MDDFDLVFCCKRIRKGTNSKASAFYEEKQRAPKKKASINRAGLGFAAQNGGSNQPKVIKPLLRPPFDSSVFAHI